MQQPSEHETLIHYAYADSTLCSTILAGFASAALLIFIVAAPAGAHHPAGVNVENVNVDCTVLGNKTLQKDGTLSLKYINDCTLEEPRFDMVGANLYGSFIRETPNVFGTSNWANVNLNNAILTYVHFENALDLSEATMVGANLNYASLSKANLYGADLSESRMNWADMGKANLYGANLYGAKLTNAYFYEANLTEADLRRASGTDAFFLLADMDGAKMQDAVLPSAKLYGASMQGANLRDAYLYGAEMWKNNLYRADLSGANLTEAKFFVNVTLSKFSDEAICTHLYCTVHDLQVLYGRANAFFNILETAITFVKGIATEVTEVVAEKAAKNVGEHAARNADTLVSMVRKTPETGIRKTGQDVGGVIKSTKVEFDTKLVGGRNIV